MVRGKTDLSDNTLASSASAFPPPSSFDAEHTDMVSEPIPLQSIKIDCHPANTTTTRIPFSSSDNEDPTTACPASTFKSAGSHPSPTTVELLITITDTGIGIPAATLPDLFKPYTQATVSTARKFGGSGLGLCITSMLVERMEGRIWAESQEGKGSEFMVVVPVRVVEDSEFEVTFPSV
ncbi:histidine kinase osmosensor [Quaeritorhiza haematococci]|nr:histidine kinase osmosensor [Quaeritorhiza haematococci]